MKTDEAAEFRCVVCGDAVSEAMSAECNWCDSRYHLNQRNDVEAKDCGQVWIDEQYLALQFACNNCLGNGAAAASTDTRVERDADRPRRYKRRDA
jgi:hypothetical protein